MLIQLVKRILPTELTAYTRHGSTLRGQYARNQPDDEL